MGAVAEGGCNLGWTIAQGGSAPSGTCMAQEGWKQGSGAEMGSHLMQEVMSKTVSI